MSMEPMLYSYNDNSALQATCQRVGNPILADMAAQYAHGRNGDLRRARIAEYGCSGGRNSYAPMHAMISALRATHPELPAECVLEDLPSNPWDQVMEEAPRLTGAFDGKVQVLCAGASFYEQVCGDESLDLAYSYVSAHFLSRESPLPSHVIMHETDGEERRVWERRAADDWEQFLLLRSRELKPGGRMMISTMGRDESGYSWRLFSHVVWEAMQQEHARGALARHELEALCIPASLRSEAEVMAPFTNGSPVCSLLRADALQYTRTEVEGERELPPEVLAPLIRRRVEAVWGGMFVRQLVRLGRTRDGALAVMRDVWDRFEEAIAADTSLGWLDMHSYYLQVTRK